MTKSNAGSNGTVLGFDPGFGNTKVCLNGVTHCVPSAVAVPREVGLATLGMRSAGQHVTIVEFGGSKYAVGQGAHNKGELRTSMDYTALTSPERLALLYGVVSQAMCSAQLTELAAVHLVVGLPVTLLEDREQAQAVLDCLKSLKREHTFTVSTGTRAPETFRVVIERLRSMAQPAGAYIDYAYDGSLAQRPGVSKSEVLVLDLGMNTLDIFVLKNGQVLERFVGGGEVGVRRLLALLNTNGHDLMELDEDLRQGTLRPDAARLDSYLGEVLAVLKNTAANLKRFSTVIPCGGGALVLGNHLKAALAAKGAQVYWPDDPVGTNVRGFWKYGVKNS